MELGDLANDPKFIDNPARVKNRVDLIDIMSKRCVLLKNQILINNRINDK